MHTGMRIVTTLTAILGLSLLLRIAGGFTYPIVQALHLVFGIAVVILAPLALPSAFEVAKRPLLGKWAWMSPWAPFILGILMLFGFVEGIVWMWVHALLGLTAIALLELAGARPPRTD